MIYGYIESIIIALLIQLCMIFAAIPTHSPTSSPSYGNSYHLFVILCYLCSSYYFIIVDVSFLLSLLLSLLL